MTLKRSITIELEGEEESDLEEALDQAVTSIKEGRLEGRGDTDDGNFRFQVTEFD
jgi:hypothetical protein